MKKKVFKVTVSLELLIVLRSRGNISKYLRSTFLFSYQLPQFRIRKIYVFDFVDFLHQIKQAEAYFAKKNRTDDDSFEKCYQDIHRLTLFELLS